MCNLYSITTNQDAIRRLFGVTADSAGNLSSMPGVFPDYEAPVVRAQNGQRELIKMRWGMPAPLRTGFAIPHHLTGAAGCSQKTAAWFPSTALPSTPPEANPASGKKDVVWFALDEARHPFAFAGIWTTFNGHRGPKSKPVPGPHLVYGFLTTSPNSIVEPIHPKAMPVILTTVEEWDAWMRGPSCAAPTRKTKPRRDRSPISRDFCFRSRQPGAFRNDVRRR